MISIIEQNKKQELEILEKRLEEIIASKPTELESYFKKFLFNHAKRLRPLFIFSICDFLEEKIDKDIINFACAIELIHSASLIHDDILDEGTKRRGDNCLHNEKGKKIAILAGDYLLSLSMGLVYEIKNINLVKIMADASYKMTKSEIEALNKRFHKPNLDEYINLLKEKTSSLFESCLLGVLEIKNKKLDKNLLDFTQNFSICFQIKDDINNFSKNDKEKIASDKDIGVYTLPLILSEEKESNYDIIYRADEFLNNSIKKTKDFLKNYPKEKQKALLPFIRIIEG